VAFRTLIRKSWPLGVGQPRSALRPGKSFGCAAAQPYQIGRAVRQHGLRACAATVTDRRYSHSQSSIFHLRFHNQSGGKMLKFSITALLFVITGAANQLVMMLTPLFVVLNVTILVTALLNRTTARVAISDTT